MRPAATPCRRPTFRPRSSLRKNEKTTALASTMPTTAFQPKFHNMNSKSHAQGRATMRTGGAAKWVRVPPTETLTKSSPRVA